MMPFCLYYRAHVDKAACLFLVAMLRSVDHLCFDRTIDQTESEFEFFVPIVMENIFLETMAPFVERGEVSQLRVLENRLINSEIDDVWMASLPHNPTEASREPR